MLKVKLLIFTALFSPKTSRLADFLRRYKLDTSEFGETAIEKNLLLRSYATQLYIYGYATKYSRAHLRDSTYTIFNKSFTYVKTKYSFPWKKNPILQTWNQTEQNLLSFTSTNLSCDSRVRIDIRAHANPASKNNRMQSLSITRRRSDYSLEVTKPLQTLLERGRFKNLLSQSIRQSTCYLSLL